MPRHVGPPIPAYPPFITEGRGSCASVDPNLFTEVGDRGAARRRRVAQAKAVCLTCPFRIECAAWALETNQTGVWGAEADEDRMWARRRQQRVAA